MALATKTSLLDLHKQRATEKNAEVAVLEKDRQEAKAALEAAESRLKAAGRAATAVKESKDVTIGLQVVTPGRVTLRLSYVVLKCSWTPSYDVRVARQEFRLGLTYFGLIQQATGEDWRDVTLTLSTATPGTAGTPPPLPSRHARLANPYQSTHSNNQWSQGHGHVVYSNLCSQAMPLYDQVCEEADEKEAAPLPEAAVATSRVEGGAGAVTFAIQRRVTCASDNKPHKVTVGILDLKATFRHFVVPSLSDKAYLRAMTRNDSEFQLLASPKVNIFVDNNFISTSNMSDVSPGEAFRFFVGVDPALRVAYRNRGRVQSTRQALLGMGRKSDAWRYSFLTTLKNTKKEPLTVVVADVLPMSSNDKVKVTLITPTAEEVARGTEEEETEEGRRRSVRDTVNRVAQNKATNNLTWTVVLGPDCTETIPFEYIIEYPQGESLVIT